MNNWSRYINKTKNNFPRPLLVQALDFVENKGSALDIGSGALNDSRYLLGEGFKKVIALDKEGLSPLPEEFNCDAFSFKKCTVEDYNFPINSLDLINAQFILPFVDKRKIDNVTESIKKSLKPRGVFVGQFFGSKDSWSNRKDVQVYSKAEVYNFLDELDILFFNEEEKDVMTPLEKMKHWHIFHFIVIKK